MARCARLERLPARQRTRFDILLVIDSLKLGGTEKHLTLVLPALRARGHLIKLYNISGIVDPKLRDTLADGGVEVLSLDNLARR
jgi:hypothetical protein